MKNMTLKQLADKLFYEQCLRLGPPEGIAMPRKPGSSGVIPIHVFNEDADSGVPADEFYDVFFGDTFGDCI